MAEDASEEERQTGTRSMDIRSVLTNGRMVLCELNIRRMKTETGVHQWSNTVERTLASRSRIYTRRAIRSHARLSYQLQIVGWLVITLGT